MTFVVALTGGIGSGKSTVSGYFSELGVPVIDADIIAFDLVKKETPAYQQIVQKWGMSVLQADGELNRQALRERIFTHNADKVWLENLLHPLIREAIINAIKAVQAPYCLVVIPLLAEHYESYAKILDHIIVIDANIEQQYQRTLARDRASPVLIQKMMQSQTTASNRANIADTILSNEGDLTALKKKVVDLHRILLKTSISGKI
jgi:dephospho-CoA kinase